MSGTPATISIRGLRVETILGAFDWEREVLQEIRIDAELDCDVAAAAASDDLKDALDYKQVSRRLTELAGESRCHLLETLIDRLATALLAEFPTSRVRLRVEKTGALRGTQSVSLSLQRSRND